MLEVKAGSIFRALMRRMLFRTFLLLGASCLLSGVAQGENDFGAKLGEKNSQCSPSREGLRLCADLDDLTVAAGAPVVLRLRWINGSSVDREVVHLGRYSVAIMKASGDLLESECFANQEQRVIPEEELIHSLANSRRKFRSVIVEPFSSIVDELDLTKDLRYRYEVDVPYLVTIKKESEYGTFVLQDLVIEMK